MQHHTTNLQIYPRSLIVTWSTKQWRVSLTEKWSKTLQLQQSIHVGRRTMHVMWAVQGEYGSVCIEMLNYWERRHYKTQQDLKTRTKEHINDVWKVIESGRMKFGPNWWGSGSHTGANVFSKYFANLCIDCTNSNTVRAKHKTSMHTQIIWKGDRIQCMKSSRTLRCKIYIVKRREILHCFREDKGIMNDNSDIIMNDNSDISSSCMCDSQFHKFTQQVTIKLRMCMRQKEVTSAQRSKQKRRKSKHSTNSMSLLCITIGSSFMGATFTPKPASPPMTLFLNWYKCTWIALANSDSTSHQPPLSTATTVSIARPDHGNLMVILAWLAYFSLKFVWHLTHQKDRQYQKQNRPTKNVTGK